jgi:hypothetical protein
MYGWASRGPRNYPNSIPFLIHSESLFCRVILVLVDHAIHLIQTVSAIPECLDDDHSKLVNLGMFPPAQLKIEVYTALEI